jgi:RNA polymerase sigma factor (sigma-70 family)
MGEMMGSQTSGTLPNAKNSPELVGRIRKGDDAAWRDLIDQYEPMLRWFSRQFRLSAEEADDLVQLTWLRCLEHIGQLTHDDRFCGWLATICRHEAIRLATKRGREVPLDGPDVTRLADSRCQESDPFAELARRDERDSVRRAITALPRRQRAVLAALMRPEERSYHDLSHRLGLPVGSIGPTRQRALSRLRNDPRLADLASKR